MNIASLLVQFWTLYADQNPSAKRILHLFEEQGEEVKNDHIAFRTFNHPKVNIGVLSQPFLKVGYKEMGQYHFKEKRLFAKHFENPSQPGSPRIFISELIVDDFSPFLQDVVNECISLVPEKITGDELIFSGTIWGLPNWETYLKLRDESEYAAWLYVYGFRVNHFTVSVDQLKKYGTLEKTNQFLKDNGFNLNTSGGEIKGTPEELLQQSSTMADIIPVKFTDRVENIPACYYEFARRFPDKDGKLYSGFIAKSADKIFESTNFYKG
jgi:hypothetical protein